ncbi:hypothetical protein DQ04_22351000, partial [Trypanosoma grayi]|uniref:hypothetical protein n=1 Tax=Trypanosoma grayi TaxID=71804 RepID=UPI0004F41E7F
TATVRVRVSASTRHPTPPTPLTQAPQQKGKKDSGDKRSTTNNLAEPHWHSAAHTTNATPRKSPSKYEIQLRFLLPRMEGLCRLRSRHPTLTVTSRLPHEGQSDTLAPSPAGCMHEIVPAATHHRQYYIFPKDDV